MGTVPDLPPPQPWMSEEESEKAWMTVRDGDLLERLLIAHAARAGAPVDVLEWGTGRSTLYFTGALEQRGLLGTWLSIEHNRGFFVSEIAPQLAGREAVSYRLSENAGEPGAEGARVTMVVFEGGDL